MPKCSKCNRSFPNRIKVNGKIRNVRSRKYCLDCSPFGKHNTKQIHVNKVDKRRCYKCDETDPDKFYGHKKSICGRCSNKENVNAIRAKKKRAVEYLGGKCKYCGYNKCINSLDFHHTNSHEKDKNFRNMRSWSWERITKELTKCELVCRNCHGEIHAGCSEAWLSRQTGGLETGGSNPYIPIR